MINGSTGYLYLFASATVAREKFMNRNPAYNNIEQRIISFGLSLLNKAKQI